MHSSSFTGCGKCHGTMLAFDHLQTSRKRPTQHDVPNDRTWSTVVQGVHVVEAALNGANDGQAELERCNPTSKASSGSSCTLPLGALH